MNPARYPAVERWLAAQRWFTGDQAVIEHAESFELPSAPELTTVALVTVAGGHRYQLVRSGAGPDRADHPATAAAVGTFVASEGSVESLRGRWVDTAPPGPAPARPIGADQSNTSVLLGGTHVLKILRRLHAGTHPEVEVGLHLAADPTAPAPRLAGWYELAPATGEPTVLGVVHQLVPGALDGWGLVLSALAANPDAVLVRVRELGVALAQLHQSLARPGSNDQAPFGQPPLDATAVWALGDRLIADPDLPRAAHAVVAQSVAALGTDVGAGIRIHGDLHLGQTLLGPDGWMFLDFEGEPDRPLADRRGFASPLRDVAGMLRSLSYAAAAHARSGGAPLRPGWEAAARAAFLDGYLAHVPPDLLPASAASAHHLLTLHETERVIYELNYERAHRPDWLPIPEAGLSRLLARATQ